MAALTRREFLGTGAAAAGALAVGTGRVEAAPARFDGTIRVATIGIEEDPIRKRAEKDLGLKIIFEREALLVIDRWVRQEPGVFDVLSGYSQDVKLHWPTGNLQPVEIARIERWHEISPLFKLGKVRPGDPHCTYGQGDAAFRTLYVDPDRSGRWESARGTPRELEGLLVEWTDEADGRAAGPEPRFCTGVPGLFNFDSFGYNARLVGRRPEQLSWAELFNPRWRGRTALINFPIIGFQDAANAAQALGVVRFADLGDPTRAEIDRLVKLLLALKKRGQFFNLWTNFDTPVGWMRSGDVVVSSMFAFQISELAALGFPIRQAAPREGYRAFAGLYSISSEVTDRTKLDACYRFLNWWYSGFAGAVSLRVGYYSAVQTTSRRFLAPGEYAYWIEGRPADRNYPGPLGDVSVRRGQVRDGGSFIRRACRISSWNSQPREADYLVRRWHEFASGFTAP